MSDQETHADLTVKMHDAFNRGDRDEAQRLEVKRSKLSSKIYGDGDTIQRDVSTAAIAQHQAENFK